MYNNIASGGVDDFLRFLLLFHMILFCSHCLVKLPKDVIPCTLWTFYTLEVFNGPPSLLVSSSNYSPIPESLIFLFCSCCHLTYVIFIWLHPEETTAILKNKNVFYLSYLTILRLLIIMFLCIIIKLRSDFLLDTYSKHSISPNGFEYSFYMLLACLHIVSKKKNKNVS